MFQSEAQYCVHLHVSSSFSLRFNMHLKTQPFSQIGNEKSLKKKL